MLPHEPHLAPTGGGRGTCRPGFWHHGRAHSLRLSSEGSERLPGTGDCSKAGGAHLLAWGAMRRYGKQHRPQEEAPQHPGTPQASHVCSRVFFHGLPSALKHETGLAGTAQADGRSDEERRPSSFRARQKPRAWARIPTEARPECEVANDTNVTTSFTFP